MVRAWGRWRGGSTGGGEGESLAGLEAGKLAGEDASQIWLWVLLVDILPMVYSPNLGRAPPHSHPWWATP